MVRKSHHLQLLRNCCCQQISVGPVDQFPDALLSKYTQKSQWRWHCAHEGRKRESDDVGGMELMEKESFALEVSTWWDG